MYNDTCIYEDCTNVFEATVVTAISNVGPKLDNDDLELDATGGLSVTRLISDGGALSAMTKSAQLNVKASELFYTQNINKEIMEVIKAEQAILNFSKIERIYNEQLAVYNDNLPLIQTAAKANIISKTDVLKLEQLKLKSEESFLTAKTSADAARLIRKKYNLNDSDKFFTIDLQKWKTVKPQLTKNNFVNKNYDEGKIIFQRKLKINYPCTSHVLAKKIHELEMKFFPIVIEDLIKTMHYE